MTTKFVKPGNTHNVALSGTVSADDVDVIGTGLIGVATIDGVSGDTIPYAVAGVFKLPKATAAEISQGEQVSWDLDAGEVDDDQATQATGDFFCGYAIEDAGAGVLEVAVDINKTAPAIAAP